MFTKKDLKDHHIVELRNGDKIVAIRLYDIERDTNYTIKNNLEVQNTYSFDDSLDVMAVYEFDKCVWSRKDEISDEIKQLKSLYIRSATEFQLQNKINELVKAVNTLQNQNKK